MQIPGLAHYIPGLMLSSFVDSPDQDVEDHSNGYPDLGSGKPRLQNPDACITLLDQGERLDGMDLQGQTALMWAAINGEMEIASRLVEAGCDVNATDWWGRTALTYAATNNHRKMIALLIEYGAEISL